MADSVKNVVFKVLVSHPGAVIIVDLVTYEQDVVPIGPL